MSRHKQHVDSDPEQLLCWGCQRRIETQPSAPTLAVDRAAFCGRPPDETEFRFYCAWCMIQMQQQSIAALRDDIRALRIGVAEVRAGRPLNYTDSHAIALNELHDQFRNLLKRMDELDQRTHGMQRLGPSPERPRRGPSDEFFRMVNVFREFCEQQANEIEGGDRCPFCGSANHKLKDCDKPGAQDYRSSAEALMRG